jgi:HSP20 family protein
MAITRYTHANPWRELDQLTNRLSRMFEGANGSFPTPTTGGTWAPAVSVEETQDELVLTAELPGMKPEDVDVQLENNILTVRGQKHEERKEDDENRRFLLWERSYGSFERSFTLPRTVRGDGIAAEFEDGLLRVRLPKAPEARSRRIEITRGARK